MSYESRRYERVNQFRVDDVEEAYFVRTERLYRPRPASYCKTVPQHQIPKQKFRSVDEALEALRQMPRFKHFK